ncbi:MAG: LysR family transcriptional regulator [Parvibaculaceae bacterium]|nr:LysR family transcriptional regulator [Parvibaculaceae bacterium]
MTRDWIDRAGEMEVLTTIVAAGSFSAAARRLDLTPSAISRIVGRMERRLGVRLLLRTTRALALTPEGEAYHRACQRILADMAEAEQAVTEAASPRGRLRISCSIPYGSLYVVPLIPAFLALYPDILLDVSLTDSVVDLIEERADVAIRVGPLPDSALMARRLGQSGRVIVASPAYLARHGAPQAPEDLRHHNCLGFNFRRQRDGWPFRRGEEAFELPVRGNVEANNGETVRRLAVAGLGIARLGAFHVHDDIEAGRLVPLLEPFNGGDSEPVHIVFIGGTAMPARVRLFIDFLAEKLGKPN